MHLMSTRPTNLRDLKEWVKERMRMSSEGGDRRVNTFGRVNKAVSINVGGKGSRRYTASKQRLRVKQNPQGTVEEVETQETQRQD
jgi:hypothetical protein